MNSFKEQLEADAEQVFFNENEFAEKVMYLEKQILAILTLGFTDARGNLITSEGTSDRAVIEVMAKDVPNPLKNQTFTTEAGVVWKIGRTLSSDGVIHQLELTANENPYTPDNNPYKRG